MQKKRATAKLLPMMARHETSGIGTRVGRARLFACYALLTNLFMPVFVLHPASLVLLLPSYSLSH
eukprot:5192900-Pleurochrysis_carterae.AAC.1